MFAAWISRCAIICIILFVLEVRCQCELPTCNYRGDCQNTEAGAKCHCQYPFSGDNCEIIGEREIFIESSDEFHAKNCRHEDVSPGEGYFYVSNNFSNPNYYNYGRNKRSKRASAAETTQAQPHGNIDTSSGMCRVLGPLVVDNKEYEFGINVRSERGHDISEGYESDVGNPGVLYNARDADNFDFIIFPIHIDDNRPCYCTGYMEAGVPEDLECHACDNGITLRTGGSVTIQGTVNDNEVRLNVTITVYEDSFKFALSAVPHFKPTGRVGVLMLNEFDEEISFGSTAITYDATPKFKNISPNYGPIAGGTVFTIFGDYLPFVSSSNLPLVKVGNRRCKTNSSDVAHVVAISPKFDDNTTHMEIPLPQNEQDPGSPLQLSLLYYNPMIDFAPESLTFTYKPNPMITDFYPKDSIVDGGIELTVEGTHLKSVATHIMVITMVYRKKINGVYETVDTREFESECTVIDDTKMSCPTPHIELPGVFVNLTIDSGDLGPQRRRRYATKDLDVESDFELNAKKRLKRDSQTKISEHEISDERLEFYVGFKSDGILSYTNQTKDNAITIYANPNFEKFEGDKHMFMYDPYETNPRITIKGQYLRIGARQVDYTVMIGVAVCSAAAMTDNEISCLPPGAEPQNDIGLKALNLDGSATVMVKVGYSEHYIGHMDYTRDRVDEKTTGMGNVPQIFMSVLISGLFAVFICAV